MEVGSRSGHHSGALAGWQYKGFTLLQPMLSRYFGCVHDGCFGQQAEYVLAAIYNLEPEKPLKPSAKWRRRLVLILTRIRWLLSSLRVLEAIPVVAKS